MAAQCLSESDLTRRMVSFLSCAVAAAAAAAEICAQYSSINVNRLHAMRRAEVAREWTKTDRCSPRQILLSRSAPSSEISTTS